MSTPVQQPAVLLLEDGTVHRGKAFGKIGTAGGEICFNTGMTGYQEVFTDPSYYGQVIIMNSVHIGNYGIKDDEVESDSVKIRALIGRNLEDHYSRKQATGSLDQYLKTNNIVCIEDIDTRALVTLPNMDGLELASAVTTKAPYTMGDEQSPVRIAVLDYGTKQHILRCMVQRGAYVKVFPARTTIAELKQFKPNGYFIANGPGDPAAMDYAITTVKEILKESKPTFGICLGHQLLALANDIPTFKMHHGHRGLIHPVKNLLTGKCEITTQNHGFGVDPDAVRKAAHIEVTHVNLNDDSIEGIRLTNKPAFSVQYHPESTPGPHDSRYLFDEFIALIKKHLN